jgi:beta-galactosidase
MGHSATHDRQLAPSQSPRERISINEGWRFIKSDPKEAGDGLHYDLFSQSDRKQDEGSVESASTSSSPSPTNANGVLMPWILSSANRFVNNSAQRHERPEGNPGGELAYVKPDFDDSAWRIVDLPHDWAIEGPFDVKGTNVSGGMGRLPSPGVGWYRKKINLPAEDEGKSIFLDVDGAMSYAAVWLNGKLVGGWPYGYASWRLDLTPYIIPGGGNQLAIRLDNPPNSSRWYPGGGIYRNVWLVKTEPVHVDQWGTQITTPHVSAAAATIDVRVTIDNDSKTGAPIKLRTEIYPLDDKDRQKARPAAMIEIPEVVLRAGGSVTASGSVVLDHPQLWGLPPHQKPNRYAAVTTVWQQGKLLDRYETSFGVREIRYEPDSGIWINSERVDLKGVNQHHDLGALGAAFNTRAAERQLELLREMGCNAIRTSHNPPAPELLELTDKMGFLVLDEIFDCWHRKKTPLDFHLIFRDWHEPDLRAFIRRDRNHPSVFLWSVGNEVSEQSSGEEGAEIAKELCGIVHEEDPTRPATTAMNFARPSMPLPAAVDVISLNYQGAGVRTNAGQYPAFHEKFPAKVILSTESAAALSTRGEYLFPVATNISNPVRDGAGGNGNRHVVSSYELYAADFGSSADRVFASQERNPYAAGEFVWSGWDYLGEPTPYYSSRSSYFGIIDLAGFKKERFYIYQARWRPDLPLAHILPHWTWPERIGQVTPVHVFTSGDEAELFLNGKSLGRKKKGAFEYRLRWDDVVYAPGTLDVVAWKNGQRWANASMKTAGTPAKIKLGPDRTTITADGRDLSFVTVAIEDKTGWAAPRADNPVHFEIEGPGEIVATDNGDPTSFESFQGHDRKAFNGLCLVIIRAKPGQPGKIRITATADGLKSEAVSIKAIALPD